MALFSSIQVKNNQGQIADLEQIRRLLEDMKVLLIQLNVTISAMADGSTTTNSDYTLRDRE